MSPVSRSNLALDDAVARPRPPVEPSIPIGALGSDLPFAVLLVDTAGVVAYANAAGAALFAGTIDEIVGKRAASLARRSSTATDLAHAILRRPVTRSGDLVDIGPHGGTEPLTRLRLTPLPDGSTLVAAIPSAHDELRALTPPQGSTPIDVSALERSDRELAEGAASIARIALGAGSLSSAVNAILALLDRVVPTAGKALGITIEQEASIEYVGASGASLGSLRLRLPLAESASAGVLAGDGAIVPVAGGEPADAALARNGMIVPLATRSRLLGVLTACCDDDAPLSSESADALRRLAASVALALDVLLLDDRERRRREREGMLATALATMEQPVFILSLDRRVLYANVAAAREYGYESAELVGLSVDDLVLPAPQGASPPVGGRVPAGAGPVQRAERAHRRKNGTQFPASMAMSVIHETSGTAVGYVLSVRNLTDERRIADQLRQSEKLAALGELVAGVAHELNNPLAGISAFAQLLLEEELSGDQNESVRLIKREADRAVGVIRDLLVFARKTGPTWQRIDINEIARLTLRLRAYGLRSAGITVEADLAPDLPPTMGDDQKLQQVVLNLLVNAEHAMRRATEKQLRVRTRLVDERLVLEIIDSGCGMSDETRQRIFEPFFTTKPAGEGTGLGLSVSYGIIDAHRGTIDVESEIDRGTCFRITLPVRHADADRTDS